MPCDALLGEMTIVTTTGDSCLSNCFISEVWDLPHVWRLSSCRSWPCVQVSVLALQKWLQRAAIDPNDPGNASLISLSELQAAQAAAGFATGSTLAGVTVLRIVNIFGSRSQSTVCLACSAVKAIEVPAQLHLCSFSKAQRTFWRHGRPLAAQLRTMSERALPALTPSYKFCRGPLQGAAVHDCSWSCRWAIFRGKPRAGAERQPNGP